MSITAFNQSIHQIERDTIRISKIARIEALAVERYLRSIQVHPNMFMLEKKPVPKS